MKLRNKKTGEIWTLTNRNEGTSAVLWVSNGSQTHVIESIEELANNFEDYEEPKGTWTIDPMNEDYIDDGKYTAPDELERYEELGLKFETEEEAEKAVEKLKAWKRLKDKGFKFVGWCDSVSDNNPDMALFKLNEYAWETDTCDDLDICFGGEDE